MIRKLILINGKGEEYDLLDYGVSPTFQIDGLGYEDDTDFLRVGNNFVPLEDKSTQGSVSIGILFWQNADNMYKKFIHHARTDALCLLYENNSGTFYLPCKLKSIKKTDRSNHSQLACDTIFTLTGKPYKIISAYNKGVTGSGKNYGLNGYQYDYTYSSDTINTLLLKSDSMLSSPCILTIYGNVVNPVWRRYSNNQLVESGAYNGTIPEGHSLVIDSKSVPYSIIEYDSSGNIVADRYALCDFSTQRFLYASEGENRFSVSHDDIEAVKLKVEAYIEYDSV